MTPFRHRLLLLAMLAALLLGGACAEETGVPEDDIDPGVEVDDSESIEEEPLVDDELEDDAVDE